MFIGFSCIHLLLPEKQGHSPSRGIILWRMENRLLSVQEPHIIGGDLLNYGKTRWLKWRILDWMLFRRNEDASFLEIIWNLQLWFFADISVGIYTNRNRKSIISKTPSMFGVISNLLTNSACWSSSDRDPSSMPKWIW